MSGGRKTQIGDPATGRQVDVLRVIDGFTAVKGYAPSVRDLAAELGITSTQGVADHIRALLKKGLVVRDPRVARSLRLTNSGRAEVSS